MQRNASRRTIATLGALGAILTLATGCAKAVDPVPPEQKRLFVTSTAYDADLVSVGGGADGPSSADRLCKLAASAAELGGHWKAWLSTSTMNAIDRISDVGPWYTPDGHKVFNNRANLATEPLNDFAVDELGGEVDFVSSSFWTGTRPGGVKPTDGASATCNDWTFAGPLMPPSGLVGDPTGFAESWTEVNDFGEGCSTKMHLLCLEQ